MSEPRPSRRTDGPARHGRQRRSRPLLTAVKVVAAALAVVLVSGVSVGAIAAWDVARSVKPGVSLVQEDGQKAPTIAATDGAINLLLAGSDSGDGNAAYGERGENLNDVTMLLHVSADHRQATVISFPRDLYVSIPSCPRQDGDGTYSSMSKQKINNTLEYGGLPCTVLTVEKLTGLEIPYAALIQFDGVVAMSNAVGGVPVCLSGPIKDPYTGLNLTAGDHTLQGADALAFLRTRHGVGDGSDIGRISNQQVFLSSLVRTLKSADTLSNPAKVYGLAKAATENMKFSDTLNSVPKILGVAAALKGIDVDKVTFVQYPNALEGDGVVPITSAADDLMTAIRNDTPITITGGTGADGVGSGPGSSGTPTTPATPGSTSTPTSTPTDEAVLPDTVHGQNASEQTCSTPYRG